MGIRHPGVTRAAAVIAAFGLLGALLSTPVDVSAKDGIIKRVADGKIKPATLSVGGVEKVVQGISAGTLTAAKLNGIAAAADFRDEEADAPNSSDIQQLSVSQGTLGCRTRNTDGNVRVNQDCTFRRQAEEIIKINPADPRNIIAGQNDSRVGYNKCGFDYSFDAGQHWGDGIPPFYQRENHPELDGPIAGRDPNNNTIQGGVGTAHTYDAGSDPAETFDSAGRAFFSCVLFDVHDNASGILVTQSPQGAGGSFYDNVSATGRAFVVVEDVSANIAHDKEFIAADAFASSPNRDNVYVTWTVFIFDPKCKGGKPDEPAFCSSPIFGSMSTDHALTWSTPEEISGSAPLCQLGNFFDPRRSANSCDFDQGSDPQPMPDGSLVVPFFNQNTATAAGTPAPNNQELAVVCHPSGSSSAGSAHLNCAPPTKVGDDVALGEPQCDFGRGPEECVPGPFIRTNDFPRVGLDDASHSVYAVWQDFRNGEYDIQISRSNDGGTTWKEGGTVNPGRGFDFYMPAVDVGNTHKVAVSFYRSSRIPNENTLPAQGFFAPCPAPTGIDCQTGVQNEPSSYWLSGRQQPDRDTDVPFAAERVSPFFPPPDGGQAGFNGDYSGLAVNNNTAHPIWSDTRNSALQTSPTQGVVHDEDVFTDSRPIPTGGRED